MKLVMAFPMPEIAALSCFWRISIALSRFAVTSVTAALISVLRLGDAVNLEFSGIKYLSFKDFRSSLERP